MLKCVLMCMCQTKRYGEKVRHKDWERVRDASVFYWPEGLWLSLRHGSRLWERRGEGRAYRWRKGERDCGLAAAPLMRDRPRVKKSPQCCNVQWFAEMRRKHPPFCIWVVSSTCLSVSLVPKVRVTKWWQFQLWTIALSPHVPVLLSFIAVYHAN